MAGKQILIIDDDETFLRIMKDILEMEGYEFTGLSKTDDIVQLARDVKPDLVLLDYCLPGTNGGELSRALQNCPEMKDIPVVLISAYPQDRLPLDRLTYSVFIPKPFDLWDFLACINELLRLKATSQAA